MYSKRFLSFFLVALILLMGTRSVIAAPASATPATASVPAQELISYTGSSPFLAHAQIGLAHAQIGLAHAQIGLAHAQIGATSTNTIVVKIGSTVGLSAAVFTVDGPPRLVIDLPFNGNRSKVLRKPVRLQSAPNSEVEAMRIAAHDDKIRIVVDLKGQIAPPYSVESRSHDLIIRLGGSIPPQPPSKVVGSPTVAVVTTVKAVPPTPPDPTAPPTPALTPVVVASPTSTPIATSIPVPSIPAPSSTQSHPPATPRHSPAITQPPEVVEDTFLSATPRSALVISEKIEAIEGPSLVGILFSSKTINGEPAVRLTLNHRPRFRLSRRDQQSYRLRVEGCKLASSRVGLPFFPPQDFVGFTMIKAAEVGTGVDVIIGTDRGSRITATPDDSDILLKASR